MLVPSSSPHLTQYCTLGACAFSPAGGFGVNVSHVPLIDYKAGFGGKYGVQEDRVDKSAMGWEHIESVEKHESQKGAWIT